MMHKFQHEQGGLDTLKTTELPLHVELSHKWSRQCKEEFNSSS